MSLRHARPLAWRDTTLSFSNADSHESVLTRHLGSHWPLAMLLIAWLIIVQDRAVADGWKAGAAKVNITPTSPMWMAGYGARDRPAEGALTDLWAKSLALEDADGDRAVLVTMDLVGIDRDLSQDVCQQISDRFGIPRERIVLSTSHTHCGPVVGKNLGPIHYLIVDSTQQQRIREYSNELERKLVEVAGEAIAKLAPSQLSWGSGTATYAVNRRNNQEAKVVELRENGSLQGPVDHDVPVLAVHNEAGQLTAVAFGYACHATVLSFYQWCGDHPGFAQAELEENHPGCIALFWAGCGADQNPLPRRTIELAKHYGERLAVAVDEVLLTSQLKQVQPQLAASYREIELPLDQLPSREQIEAEAKSDNRFFAARGKLLLEELEKVGKLDETYPYPISVWNLGEDLQFISLGGEVVVDYALRLKSELKGKRTWVAGYAHDVMAYIPSRRVLHEGGYEGGGAMVYYGLPGVWSPEVEERIVAAVHEVVKSVK